MKNIYMTIIALATLLSFAGCTKETGCPAEEAVTGRIALAAQYEAANGTVDKRAVQTKAAGELTYVIEVWANDYSERITRKEVAESELYAGGTVEIAIVPGNYNFLFWADYDNGYYITDNAVSTSAGGLRSVKYEYDGSSDMGAADGRDAFATCKENVEWGVGGTAPSLSAVLVRPLAKLSITASENFAADDADASIQCSDIPTGYDVATAAVTELATIAFKASIKSGSAAIGDLFLFVPSGGSTEVSLLDFGEPNETKKLGEISVAPNYVTNVTVTM